MTYALKAASPSSFDLRTAIHDRVGRAHWFDVPVAGFDYNSFFAATDALLDVSELLIAARQSVWPANDSEAKIWLYGTLQALIVQQEARIQLLECFCLTCDPEAKRCFDIINDFRIRVAGHPHNHRRWKGLSAKGVTFLSHRIGPTVFNIGTYPDVGDYKTQAVDVARLLTMQNEAIESNLSAVWSFIVDDLRFEVKLLQEAQA